MVYVHNIMLLCNTKERNFAFWSHMNGFGRHYAKWNRQTGKISTVYFQLYVESKQYNKLYIYIYNKKGESQI